MLFITMELYLCNSIDQLNLQAELPSDKYKSMNPKMYVANLYNIHFLLNVN